MFNPFRSLAILAGLAAGVFLTATPAHAQFSRVPGGGWGGGVTVMPGAYYGTPGGTSVNPWTGSVYRPWAGVVSKPSGNYFYVPGTGNYTPWGKVPGSGVYQNPWTGNMYNPGSGAYVRQFR
jgi:hypothetical protein